MFKAKALIRSTKEIVNVSSIDFHHEEPFLIYMVGEQTEYTPLTNVAFINLPDNGRNSDYKEAG